MNKIIKLSVALILLVLMAFSVSPKSDTDCGVMHNGTFVYGSGDNLVKVVIKGTQHIEYHKGGKYYIKSKLEWLNGCAFNMTMKKVTIPNFPFKKGDVMHVQINRVVGNKIFYTSTVKGRSWDGVFIKVK